MMKSIKMFALLAVLCTVLTVQRSAASLALDEKDMVAKRSSDPELEEKFKKFAQGTDEDQRKELCKQTADDFSNLWDQIDISFKEMEKTQKNELIAETDNVLKFIDLAKEKVQAFSKKTDLGKIVANFWIDVMDIFKRRLYDLRNLSLQTQGKSTFTGVTKEEMVDIVKETFADAFEAYDKVRKTGAKNTVESLKETSNMAQIGLDAINLFKLGTDAGKEVMKSFTEAISKILAFNLKLLQENEKQ